MCSARLFALILVAVDHTQIAAVLIDPLDSVSGDKAWSSTLEVGLVEAPNNAIDTLREVAKSDKAKTNTTDSGMIKGSEGFQFMMYCPSTDFVRCGAGCCCRPGLVWNGDDCIYKPMKNGLSMVVCMVWSVVTGLTYTAAILVISLPRHFAQIKGEEVSTLKASFLQVVYYSLNIASIIPNFYAAAHGPVSVVVPVFLSSQVLSNMLLQWFSGSLIYSKSMRMGTFILAVAALQLIDVGPLDAPEFSDPFGSLMDSPSKLAWIIFMTVLLFVGFAALPCVWNASPNSLPKLLAFTLPIGVSAALNNSLSKVVPVVEGEIRIFSMCLYLALGASSTVLSGLGTERLNNALSAPAFMVAQLFFNAANGIFLWGDLERTKCLTAYALVYYLFFMAIYLCSSIDFGPTFLLVTCREGLCARLQKRDIRDTVKELQRAVSEADGRRPSPGVAQALMDCMEAASQDDMEGDAQKVLNLVGVLSKSLQKYENGDVGLSGAIADWILANGDVFKSNYKLAHQAGTSLRKYQEKRSMHNRRDKNNGGHANGQTRSDQRK